MDIEIELLNHGATFTKLNTFDHKENTVYEFENVRYLSSGLDSKIRVFKGTYLPIVPCPHYFHFLKEYVGSFLYYRKHIDKDAKVLWIESRWGDDKYHDTDEPIQQIFEMLSEKNIPIVYMSADAMTRHSIEFEKIAVIYDTSTYIVSTQFPYFDQFKHTNNVEVRAFLKRFLIKDPNYPSKVYVSRRKVSEELEKKNMKDHISRYNEKHVEDALEDFFVSRGYKVIDFSGMPLKQQIMHMYNATHVAGLMGAGTWNGIFCDYGVKYFCLKTHMWFHHEYNKDIETVIDFDYRLIEIYDKSSYNSVMSELTQKAIDA